MYAVCEATLRRRISLCAAYGIFDLSDERQQDGKAVLFVAPDSILGCSCGQPLIVS